MKLNNNGWGMVTFILCCIGILFFLFLAIYFISVLYKDLGIE